jgi:hypothetical protein
MGFLEKFEKTLERVVTGAFSKTFKSELQPIEIISALKNEMDANAAVVSRERILVPNAFKVNLGAEDFNRLKALGENLLNELNQAVTAHAAKQRQQFASALQIEIHQDPSLRLGQLRITSNSVKVDVSWAPALEVNGNLLPLRGASTSVGRDASADLQIDDSGLSRKHFEIVWDGKNAGLRDLGSTNGTLVNGVRTTESALPADSVITAGRTTFVFRVIAKTVSDE